MNSIEKLEAFFEPLILEPFIIDGYEITKTRAFIRQNIKIVKDLPFKEGKPFLDRLNHIMKSI